MALPGDVTTATLTFGPYTDASGEPVLVGATGKIKPSVSPIRHAASGSVVIDSPILVVIDAFGVASVELAHTDQAVLSPVGFTYTIVWDVASRKPSPGNKHFTLPASAGSEVDFDLLAPSPEVEGVVIPTALSVNGKTGAVVLDAEDVGAVPASGLDAAVAPLVDNVASATGMRLRAAFVSPLNLPLNVRDFGTVADGDDAAGTGTDNTTALRTALLAAEAQGRNLYVPPGDYRITDTLPIPSRVLFYGDGPGAVTIFNTTAGKPALASKTWLSSYGGQPSGRPGIKGMTVRAEGTDPGSHGIVMRDYYPAIDDVVATQCGGDGFRITAFNQAGTRIGFTLVEGSYSRLLSNQCKGYGFNQDTDQPLLTDSFLTQIVVRGVTGALGGIRIPFAAGWQLRHFHTYGEFAGAGVEFNRMWGSIIDGGQIEHGWGTAGLRLGGFQRAGVVDNIHIAMSATGIGLDATQDTTLYPGAGLVIGSLSIVASVATTGTGVSWNTTSRPLVIGQLLASGENLTGLTLLGGSGATAIRVNTDLRVLSKVRDSASGRTLTVSDSPLAIGGAVGWGGSGAKTLVLPLPRMTLGSGRQFMLTIGSSTNYTGAKRATYVGAVMVGLANGGAANAYLTDVVAPVGFDAVPTVAVTTAPTVTTPGELTVTFTPTATDGYGSVGLTGGQS